MLKWFLVKKDEKGKEDQEEVVECFDCKHLIRKDTAAYVEFSERYNSYGCVPNIENRWFCSDHKKPYDFIEKREEWISGEHGGHHAMVERYYINCKYVEVNEKGKQVKLIEYGKRN